MELPGQINQLLFYNAYYIAKKKLFTSIFYNYIEM